MAQQHQLVGIVEIDPGSAMDTTCDENIGDTLRRLRCAKPYACNGVEVHDSGPLPDIEWYDTDDAMSEPVVILQADLRQLHCDLEIELTLLLDRLLTVS